MSTYDVSSLHEGVCNEYLRWVVSSSGGGGLCVVWVVAVVPDAVIFLLISVIIEHRCPCLLVQTMSPVSCQLKNKHRQCLVLITDYVLLQ